jgi:hypothetical protein
VTADPYKLIDATVASVRRRMRENVVLPAVPPAMVIVAAAALGRLPIEIAAAATIAFGLLLLRLASQHFERREAAAFLDARLDAKEAFLTIATIQGQPALRPAVEQSAGAIASAKPAPQPPPRRARPVLVSLFASLVLLAILWVLPQTPLFASPESSLDRIAEELERAGDGDLARELRTVAGALRDPALSKDDKRKQVAAMMAKIDQADQKKKQPSSASGSSGSDGKSGQQGGRGEQESKEAQQKGAGKGSGKNQEGQGGEQTGASARGEARKQLEKIAGELGAGSEGEKQQQGKSEQGKEKKAEPSGGGIQGPQGPEDSAKERKPSDRDATGNQPGKDPNKSGGNESQGGSEGQAKADHGQEQNPDQRNPANQGKGDGAGGGTGEGAGKQPSHAPSDKPAERFYKPGENRDGGIVDGQYVRIRVPDDRHQLPGTEEVSAPGEVVSEVPYGNAPVPPPGPPGDVATDQPVPLEYRSALGNPK